MNIRTPHVEKRTGLHTNRKFECTHTYIFGILTVCAVDLCRTEFRDVYLKTYLHRSKPNTTALLEIVTTITRCDPARIDVLFFLCCETRLRILVPYTRSVSPGVVLADFRVLPPRCIARGPFKAHERLYILVFFLLCLYSREFFRTRNVYSAGKRRDNNIESEEN